MGSPDQIYTPFLDRKNFLAMTTFLHLAYFTGQIRVSASKAPPEVTLYGDLQKLEILQAVWLLNQVFATLDRNVTPKTLRISLSPEAIFVFECIGRADLARSRNLGVPVQQPAFIPTRILSCESLGEQNALTFSLVYPKRGVNLGGLWVTGSFA
jgi:hypothetical protein